MVILTPQEILKASLRDGQQGKLRNAVLVYVREGDPQESNSQAGGAWVDRYASWLGTERGLGQTLLLLFPDISHPQHSWPAVLGSSSQGVVLAPKPPFPPSDTEENRSPR